MLIAGHQPNYLPNLDYFAKMLEADRFVIFTNTQFNKRDWQRRNRIPREGQDIWLSVGIRKAPPATCIHAIQTDESSDWRRKHRRHLEAVYGKTGEADLLREVLAIYDEPWPYLADLSCALIDLTRAALRIDTPVVRDDIVAGAKEELLAAICKSQGGTTYLSGQGARDYLTEERLSWLASQGVRHRFARASLGADHPYAALHYVFTQGATETQERLRAAIGLGVTTDAAVDTGAAAVLG